MSTRFGHAVCAARALNLRGSGDTLKHAQYQLFGRYLEKLVRLARKNLKSVRRTAKDEEDVPPMNNPGKCDGHLAE